MLDVGALYEAHAPALLTYVRRHMRGASAPDADDVAHDVWLRAVRAADRYRDEDKPKAWLFQIARNLVTDYRRRRALVAVERIGAEAMAVQHPQAHREYARIEQRLWLAPAIADLTHEQREVVDLRYYRDQDTSMMAERLGMSDNGVKQRQRRALVRMRRHLEATA